MVENPDPKAARLEAMLRAVGDHMSMMDRELTITWVNETARRRFGPDMVGRKCYEVYHQRETPCTAHPCSTRLAFEDGEDHQHEAVVTDKDGNAVHFHCTASVALRDDKGNPTEVIEISKDITRLKIAEEALQRELERQAVQKILQLEGANESLRASARAAAYSEERYRLLIETMNEGLTVIDENALYTFVNDSFCSMLGYPREEVVGRPVSDFLDAFNRNIFAGQLNGRKKGERASYELVWQKRGGEEAHSIVSSSPLLNPDGQYAGAIALIMDITQRKRAEEALRKGREQYRLLVENAPAGIYEVDFVQKRFVSVNDIMCEYTGYSREEFLEMDPLDLLTDESKALFLGRMKAFFAGHEIPEETIYRVRGKNGQELWAHLKNRFIYREGKPCGANVVIHDVTRLKETEDALRHSESELRRLSSRLLNVQEEERRRIALDLHDTALQKLAYIKMLIGMKLNRLTAGGPPPDPAFLKEVSSLIKESISDIRASIEDLRPSMLDQLGILSTVRDHCQQFVERHPSMALEAKTDIQEQEIPNPIKVPMFRILQEALANIGKHSHATRVHVSLQKEDGKISLEVSDNGSGFEPGLLSSQGKPEGGFGLTSMKERTQLSGGTFLLLSNKDKGTTIQAKWPKETNSGNACVTSKAPSCLKEGD